MSDENAKPAYLCPNGHLLERPGICPIDGIFVEAAHYVCKYCGYATQHSKSGLCPHCDAEMVTFPPGSCEWPRKERAA